MNKEKETDMMDSDSYITFKVIMNDAKGKMEVLFDVGIAYSTTDHENFFTRIQALKYAYDSLGQQIKREENDSKKDCKS